MHSILQFVLQHRAFIHMDTLMYLYGASGEYTRIWYWYLSPFERELKDQCQG